ncbi:MAG TPA: LCP family protein [Coriobacteriia bacterium]|jgi:LCP family protein required for cell wall assembly
MGRHSSPRRNGVPREIDRLEPVSGSRETMREANRRQREVRLSPAEMARRRQRTRRTALGCLAVLVLLVLIGAAAGFAYYQSVKGRIEKEGEKKNPGLAASLKESARPPGDPFYMVLMGEDKRPEELRARSDTLMIAYVDPPRRKVSLLSIPRDTRVDIPGHGKQKINSAMQLGGATLVIRTVKEYTGLPISHYMEVDFNGFKDLVNAVGGVTVDVPERIVDSKAADHNWRAKVVNKGVQWLDGDHALTFVRSRHFADGDFTRIKDQQIFMKALAKKTFTAGNIVNLPKIVDAVVNNVTTDLSVPQMLNLAADFKGMEQGGLSTAMAPGDAKYINGVSFVIPDRPALMELVRRMESGESLESTAASLSPKAAVSPQAVTITVRNGGGPAGVAKEVADLLKKDGFRIGEVGNTGRPVFEHTLIVFKTSDAKAQIVHETLGFGTVVKSSSLYQFKTDILVIVGKDWRKEFPKPKP